MSKKIFDAKDDVLEKPDSRAPLFIIIGVVAVVLIGLIVMAAWQPKPTAEAPTDTANTTNSAFPAGTEPTAAPTPPPSTTPATNEPTEAEIAAAKKAGTRKAIIKTVKGDIEVELYGADAPLTVANFVKLAKSKFYDGLTFHRVETDPGFQLIQGGCPDGTGSGGPGYSIAREISPKLRHVEGALAMARSALPDSAGSQFYICNCATPGLDNEYAVFGKVTKGLSVSKKIVKGDKITQIIIK